MNNNLQESHTNFEENQFSQNLNYTRKISSNTALVSNILYGKNKLLQRLSVFPDFRISEDSIYNSSNQDINTQKTYFDINAYFLKGNEHSQLKLGIGYTFDKIDFYSLLNPNDTITSKNKYN